MTRYEKRYGSAYPQQGFYSRHHSAINMLVISLVSIGFWAAIIITTISMLPAACTVEVERQVEAARSAMGVSK